MAKENYISFRANAEFHGYLRQLSGILSVQEGRNVRVTDVAWRIIDLGLPLLKDELDQSFFDSDAQLLHKKFEILAALRATRRILHLLEGVSQSATKI